MAESFEPWEKAIKEAQDDIDEQISSWKDQADAAEKAISDYDKFIRLLSGEVEPGDPQRATRLLSDIRELVNGLSENVIEGPRGTNLTLEDFFDGPQQIFLEQKNW